MCGYKAISDWAKSLGTKARERFGCRRENGHRRVPSEYVIRDVLVRVDPVALDHALQRWNETHGEADESLAIDGKTMCNAIDAQGRQTHIMKRQHQPGLLEDVALYFQERQEPDCVLGPSLEHGRIETRKIWTTSALNDYLDFPHVGQAFLIEHERIEKKTGKRSSELAYGITSRLPEQADAQRVLKTNRGHWSIENSCHYVIDWNFDEDRSRIRAGHGPENVTRLRRFAVGIVKSKGVSNVAQKMRQLHRSTRLVFDYLRMSQNTCTAAGA